MRVRRRSGRGLGCNVVMQMVALVVMLAVVVTATRRLFAWSELELSLASLRVSWSQHACVQLVRDRRLFLQRLQKIFPSLTAIRYYFRKQHYTGRHAVKVTKNNPSRSTAANMSQHVPAWKKIGLKLKYAKETADDVPVVSTLPEPTNGPSHAGAKRSREEDVEQESTSAAKRNKQSQREIRTESPAPRSILSGSQSPTKTPANRKAVSFSAETKAEDGETGQNYFKAWAAGQPHTPPKPSTEILVPETPESAEKPSPIKPQDSPAETKAETKAKAKAAKRDKKKADQAAALTQNPDLESMPSLQERRESKAAKKAAKQERKAQEQQPVAAQEAQGPASAYVEYLHHFHHDKTTWKFNKSKENHLLKNVWSMYRVPAPYTDALVNYIAGLQGAGARTRLVEGADEVLRDVTEKGGQKFEFNGYEEPVTRREAYTAALNRLRASSEPTPNLDQEDFDRATRAEAVLKQLLTFAPLPVPIAKPTAKPIAAKPILPFVDVPEAPKHARWAGSVNDSSRPPVKKITFDDDDEPAPAPVAVKAKQPARRKRKARTDVSSDESSSDSSSDESSSSNSETESGSDSDSGSD
jgi:hypothetical protein